MIIEIIILILIIKLIKTCSCSKHHHHHHKGENQQEDCCARYYKCCGHSSGSSILWSVLSIIVALKIIACTCAYFGFSNKFCGHLPLCSYEYVKINQEGVQLGRGYPQNDKTDSEQAKIPTKK